MASMGSATSMSFLWGQGLTPYIFKNHRICVLNSSTLGNQVIALIFQAYIYLTVARQELHLYQSDALIVSY